MLRSIHTRGCWWIERSTKRIIIRQSHHIRVRDIEDAVVFEESLHVQYGQKQNSQQPVENCFEADFAKKKKMLTYPPSNKVALY